MGDSEGEEGKHSPSEGGEVEGKLSSPSFPLFAVSNAPPAVSGGTSEAPRWLRNPSFTADVSAINRPSGAAAETSFRPPYDGDEEEEEEEVGVGGARGGAPPTESRGYELVGSSSPSSEERRTEKHGERIEKKRKKKKRRRGEGEERRYSNDDSRRTKVRAWASAQSAKPVKEYYIDVRGDPDNLVFGSLYRFLR